jgi:dihydrofolate synthase/folylpolyglutamate synthase
MLPPLLERVQAAVLTVPRTAPPGRRWDPAGAAEALGVGSPRLLVMEDFDAALQVAAERAGSGTVVVTGSVHTVGNAMGALGIDPLA